MGGKSGGQIVGFRYGMGLHFSICYGPVDKFLKLIAGERVAWSGAAETNSTIDVDAPQLFGGDEKEGGIVGTAEVMMGGPTQTLPANLAALLPTPAPAFRGVFSLFYNGLISSNNPYIKPFAFHLQRIFAGWKNDDCWYPAKAAIPSGNIIVGIGSASFSGTPTTRFDYGDTCKYLAITDADLTDRSSESTAAWSTGAQPLSNIADPAFLIPAVGTVASFNIEAAGFWIAKTISLAAPGAIRVHGYGDNLAKLYINGVEQTLTFVGIGWQWYADYVPTTSEIDVRAVARNIVTGVGALSNPCYVAMQVTQYPGGDYDTLDMNPAHIVYECLTNEQWGMGYPVATIDTATFTAAADTLFDEGFGLSLLWNQQEEIGAFIRVVLDHIGGIFYADPATGKFCLKLLRADYEVGALPVFDESNVEALSSFQRVGYGDTINEITVVYRDSATNRDVPVTVQNLANVQAQGAVVNKTVQYPGISHGSLAGRVAQRDLIAQSTPLAKARLSVNRKGWSLFPGSCLKLTWPKLGLSNVIFRVLGVDYGQLDDGTLDVDIAEDVFGLPASTYLAQEPGGWVPPVTTPTVITAQTMIEAPYLALAQVMTPAELAAVDADEAYMAALASKPASLSQRFDIHSRTGAAAFAQRAKGDFVPSALLLADVDAQATVFTLESGVDLANVDVDDLAMIGEGRAAEWLKVVSIDTAAPSVTVARGILDTTPAPHLAGAQIFFGDARAAADPTERATGEVVDMKLATTSTGGTLDVSLATAMTATADQRQFRPYPPGNVEVNGEAWPSAILVSDIEVTWAHRDRILQTADLVEQSEGSIGPEAGTTYNLELRRVDTDALLDAAGVSDSVALDEVAARLRFVGADLFGVSDLGNPNAFVARFDAAGNELGRMTMLTPQNGYPTAFTDDGASVYVAAIAASFVAQVHRIDPATIVGTTVLSAAATYSATLAADPQGLAHDGTALWVAQSYSGNLKKLNGTTLAVEATHAINAGIGAMVHDAGSLFICDRGTHEIIEWDIATTAELRRIACASFPIDVLVTATHIYVAGGSQVTVHDRPTGVELLRLAGGLSTFEQGLALAGTQVVFCDTAAESLVYLQDAAIVQTLAIDSLKGVAGSSGPAPFASTGAGLYATATLEVLDDGLDGTTATLSAAYTGRVQLELWSARDGVESWQRQVRIFDYAPDGLTTEDGDDLITTEGGDLLQLE